MKIGFLAMSGIRVQDQELLKLGLTLPAFVNRGEVIASLPSLGLLYLAAYTPAGHDLKYFESESLEESKAELFECDLVAISTFSAQIFEAYEIADQLRQVGVIVAMGGLHVTVLPEEALKHADHVIIGEGEPVWPSVVEAAARGERARLWDSKKFGAFKIDTLITPRYDLLASKKYNRFTVQTSRGCPWRCEFCASNVMLGLPYRKRPVKDVVRDIREILKFRTQAFIEFADDNTFVDKKWGLELCREIAPLNIKWFTETDISVADNPLLLESMARSGCRQVLIGLESPLVGPLNNIELKRNFKAARFEKYHNAVKTIQSFGLTVNGCFVLGLDHQNADIFQEVFNFVDQTNLFEVQITILTPFPGTHLYIRLLKEGRIIKPEAWDLCTLFDINFLPNAMSTEELKKGFYWLTSKLYEPKFVEKRRRAFFGNIKNRMSNKEGVNYGLHIH